MRFLPVGLGKGLTGLAALRADPPLLAGYVAHPSPSTRLAERLIKWFCLFRGVTLASAITAAAPDGSCPRAVSANSIAFHHRRRRSSSTASCSPTSVFSGFEGGACRDRTGDLRLAKPREADDDRRRPTTEDAESHMVKGDRALCTAWTSRSHGGRALSVLALRWRRLAGRDIAPL